MKPADFESLRQYCRDDQTFEQLLNALAASVPGFIQELDKAKLSHHIASLQKNPFVTTFPGIVFVGETDNQRTLRFVSQDCLTLTGYTSEELINNHTIAYRQLILAEDWPQVARILDQCQAQQTNYSVEYRIRDRAGHQRWVLERGTGLKDSQNRLLGFQGLVTEITDQKRVAEALKLSQERYSLAVNAGGVGVWEWNLRQNTLFADAALRRMLGYRAQEPLNTFRHLIELIYPSDRDRFTEKMRAYLSGIDPDFELEHRVWHKSKAIRWFRTYGVAIRSANGQAERLVCMATDITRQREAELQIQSQAEQLRETLNSSRLLGLIATRIRKSLDLEDILHTTVEEVRKVFKTDRVLIYRLDRPDQGILVASAWDAEWSITEEMSARYLSCLIQPKLNGPDLPRSGLDEYEDYCQGKTVAIANIDLQNYATGQLKIVHKLRIRSKLIVPILQGSLLWGLLVLHQCIKIRQWQISEVDLLEKLSDQVGIAIQQAQLFQQVQQQAQRERLLNEISSRLNTRLNPQDLLTDIVQLTGESLNVDRAYIFARGAEQAEILAEWRAGAEVVSVSRLPSLIALLPKIVDPFEQFEQHHCFHAPNYAQVAPAAEGQVLIDRAHTRSVLSVPVFIRGNLYGGLVLETTTCYRLFQKEEIQLLERISDQAAIALYNAQSYEYLEWQVRERTQELEEQKQISEAANQAKSQFLAIMSHELRTPLNSILGLSNLLGQEMFGNLNPKQREYIACIQSSGEHLRDLIGDILDLTKVESGRESLDFKPVSIPDLCTHCLAMVKDRAAEKQLKLTHQLDPEAQACIADERRLRQMLLNLLSNAIKFTPAGEISLQIRRHANGTAFSVKDTGIGISEIDQQKLFAAFYQVDGELNRQFEGTGLGLALTRQLARLHGGDVTVQSMIGQGSTFTIYLPDHLTTPNSPISVDAVPSLTHCPDAPSGSTPSHLKVQTTVKAPENSLRKRILIVEDDVKSAMLLKDYLQVLGYEVEHLAITDSFLHRVKQFKPQLVLMDIKLDNEDVSGLDLLQMLRQDTHQQTLPVVIVSAQALAGDREHFLSLGANDYISKPINIPSLELILTKYL
jgi:PAS domain S-box-containing protein